MTCLLSAEEMEGRRTASDRSYEERKSAVEARVVRRVWATGPVYSFQPFDAERGGWSRGRLLKGVPKDVSKKFEFGFGVEEELLVVREHTQFEGRFNESFVDAADRQWVWRYQHRDPSQPQALLQRGFDGDRHVGTAVKSRFGFTRESYRWHAGFIRTIEVEFDTGDTNRFQLDYAGGVLSEVRVGDEGGEPRVVFTNEPPDRKVLLATLVERLPRVVARVVAAAGEHREVFCLVLSYSDESPEEMAFPSLSLGLEKERLRWRASGGAPSELWNPATFSTHDTDALALDDETLREVGRALAQTLQTAKDFTAVRTAFCDVAKALAARGWTGVLTPTADFKVVAVHADLSDLGKNLSAIYGKAVVAELRRDGLL